MKKPSLKHYLALGLAVYSATIFVCGSVFRLQSELQHKNLENKDLTTEQIKASNECYNTQKIASTNLMISGTLTLGVAAITKAIDVLDKKEEKSTKNNSEKTK